MSTTEDLSSQPYMFEPESEPERDENEDDEPEQRLHMDVSQWRLRKFGMTSNILKSFYTCTVENILTGGITAWFGNSTAGNRKALQRVVRTASHIVGGELPSFQDIYTRRCMRKARKIISDFSHPSHRLSLLPYGRRFRSIRSRTSRLTASFLRLSG
ncbi:hypothetical protein PO909_000565 [Leuciscus waleckii]